MLVCTEKYLFMNDIILLKNDTCQPRVKRNYIKQSHAVLFLHGVQTVIYLDLPFRFRQALQSQRRTVKDMRKRHRDKMSATW